MEIDFGGECIELNPLRCAFIRQRKMLLLADLHLGKAAHFRRHGLAVPGEAHTADYARIDQLLASYQPAKILILGDLFHSAHNPDWEQFADFIRQRNADRWMLVEGNHDILSAAHYRDAGLQLLGEAWIDNGICFRHEPAALDLPVIAGHVHPGAAIEGRGRQRLRLPCFHISGQTLTLPAFGALTGLFTVYKNKATDRIYAIAGDKIYPV